MNLNSSPFPIDQVNPDHTHYQQHPFAHQVVSSSSSSSCHNFFNSTQDHSGYFHRQSYHQKDVNYGYDGGSAYEIKNKVNSSALKLTVWKKEDEGPAETKLIKKTSLAQKMKKTISKLEDQKLQQSSSLETDLSSSSYNSNSPIRVCSDCHTTKTPLWRSGPQGPKSLCNACGIRQRKARRAMAAANGAAVASNQPTAVLKIKLKHKEKIGKNEHSSQLKKRCKMASAAGSSSDNGQKKLGFEDFLINLSNNLSFHRVFPQDEKDAAILLMALSSGLVHG